MRIDLSLALILFCSASASFAARTPPPPEHPILGTWEFTEAGEDCSELYHFRSDGTTLVTSGAEVAELEYQIVADPSPKGFYRIESTVVKDNGKQDCAGELTEVGQRATIFIQLLPSGEAITMCQSESTDACFGPLRRVPGQDS